MTFDGSVKRETNLTAWGYGFLGLLCTPVLLPLLHRGFSTTHDGTMHLYRLLEFEHLLRAGIIYPRWAPDFAFGYGYPIFTFYPSGSLYVAVACKWLSGFGYLAAMKAVFALGIFLSAWTMFLFGKELYGKTAYQAGYLPALLSSVAYVYAPYHLTDIYVRGTLSQTLAYGIMPLVLWAFLRRHRTGQPHYLWIATGSYALLLYTHHVTAFLFTSYYWLLVLTLVLQARTWRAVYDALLVFGLALGCSALYWLPALAEAHYVKLEAAITQGLQITEHFLTVNQPFQTTLLYQYAYDGIAFRMGLIQVLLTVGALVVVCQQRMLWQSPRLFFVLSVLLYYLFQFPVTAGVWQRLPLAPLVQFPWRLLMFVNFSAAVLLGYLLVTVNQAVAQWVDWRSNRAQWLAFGIGAILCIGPVLFTIPYTATVFERDLTWAGFAEWEWETFSIGTTSSGEYLPEAVDRIHLYRVTHRNEAAVPAQTSVAVETVTTSRVVGPGAYNLDLYVDLPHAMDLYIHHFYFPGWQATLDGKPVTIAPVGPLGLIGLSAPAGTHLIQLRLSKTWIQQISEGVTLLTVGGLLLSMLKVKSIWTYTVFPCHPEA